VPLQNRVLPTQEIVADPGRGLLMGNRGCIHRADRTLGTTRWRSKLWICCATDVNGRGRDVMPPGRWTALFFLDEATALAAGHRPCAYCRRAAYNSYVHGWQAAQRCAVRPKAYEMDAVLHRERVEPYTRRQRTRMVAPTDLPDGAMVRWDGVPGLLLGGRVLPWSWQGYGRARPVGADPVELLTPPASVGVLRHGYRPVLHPSAENVVPPS
jgi:hypothetical protein